MAVFKRPVKVDQFLRLKTARYKVRKLKLKVHNFEGLLDQLERRQFVGAVA